MSYASCLPCALLQCSRIAPADPCRGPVRGDGLPARSAPSRQGRRGANERAEPAFFPHAVRVPPTRCGWLASSRRDGALDTETSCSEPVPDIVQGRAGGHGLPIVVTLARQIIVERRWSTAICPSSSEAPPGPTRRPCSLSLNGIRPACPCVIWEALRCNALRRNVSGAGGNRRLRGHCHGGQPARLPAVALRVSAAPGLGTGAQKRPNRTMAGTWGRSP
jgi:hypothetical protein